ncbi:hypothetical protein BDV36DRAFT_289718 [Aspergillus pseudocaelatus]|uniref:Uncharacterized protein n=1 Tax=Aspergillus pseudocaelatus TaxID=1825620 RepID=A0ABQ6VZG4_9EURO|nr:hypothetical protein BDV36DRAFT_289718 [Aspergillus pseudocaelatus]
MIITAATLLQNSFQMDGPITTDSDYTGGQRPFSGPISFSMDDEDHSRRGSAVGHPLAQPVSIPATNGLRYNTQQSALQDVPFATSPTILMSPTDSCPGNMTDGLPYRNLFSRIRLNLFAFAGAAIR